MVARTQLDGIEWNPRSLGPTAGMIDPAESDEGTLERDQATETRHDDEWLPAGSAQLGIP